MRHDKGRAARWFALALLVGALCVLAAGCGGDDDDESAGGGTTTAETTESDLPTEVGEGEGRVDLIAWAGYVEDGSTDP